MSDRILDRYMPSMPQGWKRVTIGECLTEVAKPITMRDSELYHLVSIRRRNEGMFHRGSMYGREILTKTLHEVVPNSFVIARMQIVHGAIALASPEFVGAAISKSYSSFLGTSVCDINFFSWLAKHPLMYAYFANASQGIVIEKMTFDQSRWLSYPIFVPPKPEQRRIAQILDAMDEEIQSTQQLIAKLEQIRHGLLHDLLTFGVGDSGHLRDPCNDAFISSSVGSIPCEWALCLGSDIFSLHSGIIPPSLRADGNGAYLYLKVDDFNDSANVEGLIHAELTFDQKKIPRHGIYSPGVIIFPKRGAAILKNRVSILTKAGTVDPNLMVLVPGPKLMPGWFRLSLLQRDLSKMCDNSGVPQLNNKHIYPLVFAVPSLQEQSRVLDRLSTNEKAIQLEKKRLDKLRRVKRGLMDDLLTGRVQINAPIDGPS